MKSIQKKFRILYVLLVLSISGISCSKDEVIQSKSNEITANVQTNAARFEQLITTRATDPFDITSFVREGDLLKINVLGGCETDAYKVIWEGGINFSTPPAVAIVVSYEPTLKIQCLFPQKHTLIVDLKKMIDDKYFPNTRYFPNTFNVVVSNASKHEDKIIDPSGEVSTKN